MKNYFTSNTDTIFAVSTGNQKSGVAVIRISGKNATSIFNLLSTPIKKSRYAYYTTISTPSGEVIDNILAIYFNAPSSFTGEDIVELHTHGSKAVINKTMKVLSQINNFRIANPGEFSIRAFQNQKMDLTQSEGLADLIDAETDAQLNQALRQYSGSIKQTICFWKNEIIRIMSLIEAYIDFPDEDLPKDLIDDIEKDISSLVTSLKNNINDNEVGERIRDGFNIAIIGEPNAGKSSLLNLLAQREIAIVSEIAGTTRDSIEVSLDIKGYPVTLHDTAGIRKSTDLIENKGIDIAQKKAKTSDYKLILIDATNNSIPQDLLEHIDTNSLVAFNKIDLINTPNMHLTDINHINISVTNNLHIDKLILEITKATEKFFSNYESSIISRQRHRESLISTLNALEEFNLNKDIEFAAEDLRIAANYLGRITGEIHIESILDKIFSSFCIGK